MICSEAVLSFDENMTSRHIGIVGFTLLKCLVSGFVLEIRTAFRKLI